MNSRIVAFILALAVLATIRVMLTRSRKLGKPFLDPTKAYPTTWSIPQLFLASFLTLFSELAFIRWIAVEVRVFAYFKNLALLLCFVGFGFGCVLARKSVHWAAGITAFLGLVLVVRTPWSSGILEGLSQGLGASADTLIWGTWPMWDWGAFAIAALLATSLFLLLLWIFIPLGQVVSRQMNLAPQSLRAYSWNLLGSLLGILAFVGVSRLMLPAWFWMSIILLGMALLQATAKDRVLVLSLLFPLLLLLHDPQSQNHYTIWTPYQQIEYSRVYARNGDFLAGYVQVNHTGYQIMFNLSPSFLQRHPKLMKEAPDENPYDLPFRFAQTYPRVLIVGAGTGNDAAAALRHDSSAVDAVEIDPAILALGKRDHPEHPYDSSRVSTHLTDARAFLKRATQSYDLVLFGLLDSHTQLSDYSNMRIDNFVYTLESLREASMHLKPDGILFLKFQVNRPWIASRLAEMLQQTFGKAPLVFDAPSNLTAAATCFVISPGARVEDALTGDARLQAFVEQHPATLESTDVPVTTDDWPYLYQREKRIPRAYISIAAIVMLLASCFYITIPEARKQLPSLFFFSMGAGFLLLETQAISRLALYFGTTWQVNAIAISGLLTTLLLANVLIERWPDFLPRSWIFSGLLAGLLAAYWLPFSRIPAVPGLVGILVVVVFAIPVFFAGLLFSVEFRAVEWPSAALGANILGAVVGGLLENLSLVMGMHALLLVTLILYCLAGVGLLRGKVLGVEMSPSAGDL